MLENVKKSVPAPRNNYYTIQHTMFKKHIVNFTEKGSTMSPEEVAELIYKDSKEEIAKQKA